MVRYGKKIWNDEFDDMKSHRAERKYRGHKLAVAIGQNKLMRQLNYGSRKSAFNADNDL